MELQDLLLAVVNRILVRHGPTCLGVVAMVTATALVTELRQDRPTVHQLETAG
ncbi:hypothetical protein ACIRVF_39070 [Kitasatospora sp. NPDC101157]|uniref:hypothetical protein n=1 Tax=Kitasatospora sp. NPDC101157 TaxID=3364098 RepID=UPI0038285445